MANYLNTTESVVKKRTGVSKAVFSIFAALAVVVSVVSGSLLAAPSLETKAGAVDPVRILFCMQPEDNLLRGMYTTVNTDDLYFNLASKSAVTSGKQDVNGGLNWILVASGMDFNEVNKNIIGQEIEKAGTSVREESALTDEELKERWNKGPRVSPFDRFGMAGTTFTSYNGEWKYYVVDPCSDKAPVDLKEGAYYDNRLEPKSTWADKFDSPDPRTVQNFKSGFSMFYYGFVTLLANIVFWVTKLMVTLTIALIGISFTDLSEVLGLKAALIGNEPGSGIFGQLFAGIYTPFIVVVMALVGFKLFIDAIVKRQLRKGLSGMLTSVLMFILGVAVSVKPGFFVNLPNDTAVLVQTVVVKTFTGGLHGDSSLCYTDIGNEPESRLEANLDGKEGQDLLDQVATNVKSSIGCLFWETFVFKPWVEGQWGTSWNETWVNGKIPEWAPDGAKELKNSATNADMVGDAAVPLGNGETVHNWALFNLSTVTNAHSPLGHEGHFSKYAQGVAHDWWRVVDVLVDYEETKLEVPVVSQEHGSHKVIEYTGPKNNPVLEQWDTWAGNNPTTRLMAALSSLFIGAFGLLAPLVFALLSSVYTLGMTIVMTFLPIMLLVGASGSRGFNAFKQWGLLLVDLFSKKIVTGLMLMAAIVFTNLAISLMSNVGWWQGSLMLVILSILLIKNRAKIISIASVSGGGSFAGTARRLTGKINQGSRMVTGLVGATATGALSSKLKGGTVADGIKTGFNVQMRSLSYQNPFLRDVRLAREQIDITNNGKLLGPDGEEDKYCAMCGERFSPNMIVKQGPEGDWYCQFCAEGDVAIDGGLEVIYRGRNTDVKEDELAPDVFGDVVNEEAPVIKMNTGKIERLYLYKDNVKAVDVLLGKGKANRNSIFYDVAETVDKVRVGQISPESIKAIPEEIKDYIDPGMLSSLVDSRDWAAVSSAIMAAYVAAIADVSKQKMTNLVKSVDENFDEIMDKVLAEVQIDRRTTMDLGIRTAAEKEPEVDELSDYKYEDKEFDF